ncbi:MAG: hypothetical protein AB1414_01160 [bacterium]
MINKKAKGARQERKAKKILELAGYNVTKVGASLGIFDLVAINRHKIKLIQVKSNYISPEEKEQIALFANCPENTSKEIWIFRDFQKEPIIKYY